jgi:hypothetical protein
MLRDPAMRLHIFIYCSFFLVLLRLLPLSFICFDVFVTFYVEAIEGAVNSLVFIEYRFHSTLSPISLTSLTASS